MITYKRLGTLGRLGNCLWEIAGTLGLAHSRGDNAVFPKWVYQPHFSIPPHLFVDHPDGEDAIEMADHMAPEHRPYLQDFGLFAAIQEQIWSYFQPSDQALDELHDQYPWFWHLSNTTAIHVRRGDAVLAQQYYRLPSLEYYNQGIAQVEAKSPGTTFMVFSDDILWCKEHFPDEYIFASDLIDPYFSGPNARDYLEFFLIRLCDHHIISNSTFSWWAAWTSDDPSPIAPRVWFEPIWDDFKLTWLRPNWSLI